MRSVGAMIALAMMVAPAYANDPVKNMVSYVVADEYCGLKPVQKLLDRDGPATVAATGMSGEALILAVYAQAEIEAISLVKRRMLVRFCQEVENLYRMSR